jgi:hypothetical protein
MDFTTFCHCVRSLCFTHQASVTSWFRTEKRNAAEHGHTNSWHLDGLGADLVPDDPAKKPFLILAAAQLGLQAFDEGDHVHVEPPGHRAPTA